MNTDMMEFFLCCNSDSLLVNGDLVYYAPIPWIIWAIAVSVLGIGVTAMLTDSSPTRETRSIVILGTEGSGKTTLWAELRGKNETVSLNTAVERIEKFTLHRSGSQDVEVCETKDIGGGDQFVGKYYSELIKEGVFIYFLVDFNRLAEDKVKVRSRIQAIFIKFKENKCNKLGFKLIATHFDLFKQKNGDISESAACDRVYATLELDQLFKDLKKNNGIERKINIDNIMVASLLDSQFIDRVKNDIINPQQS